MTSKHAVPRFAPAVHRAILALRAPCRASLLPLAASAFVAACGDPAGPEPDLSPWADVVVLPTGGQLEIEAAVNVETVDPEHIRERVEITSRFKGLEPVDPNAQTPTLEDIQLEFEVSVPGVQEPRSINFVVAGDAWTALDGGDFFEFEVADPQLVHEMVKVEVLESGQAVAVLTNEIAGVEGNLMFDPDLDVWELKLELTGIVTPSMIVTPTMFNPLAGAGSASLVIASNQVTTQIRENDVSYGAAALVLEAETRIEEAGPESVREVVAIHTDFVSSELEGDPQTPAVEDIQLDFQINLAGAVGPSCIRFVIAGEAWMLRKGQRGGRKVEADQPEDVAKVLQALVLRDGQVVADLTNEIESMTAWLRFDPNTESWELRLQFTGIIIPTDVIAPMFHPIAGAGLAALEIGEELEQVTAAIREAQAIFDGVTPSDLQPASSLPLLGRT